MLWTHGIFHPIDVDDHSSIAPVLDGIEGFHVVRHDTRGSGRTPASAKDEAHTWDKLGQELLSLADALGADRFVAGGISMGAAISLHAATLAPDRVAGLVLLAPPTAWEKRPPECDNYRALAALPDPDAVARKVEADLSAILKGGITPPLQVMLDQIRASDPVALGRVLRAAALSDLPERAAVARLSMPTLLLPWDTTDQGHPLWTAEEIKKLMPTARLTIVEGVDDVAGILAASRAFLAACRASLAAQP
jgi:3-oxoadipate enol-lactonase